jgi:hypothetical protein
VERGGVNLKSIPPDKVIMNTITITNISVLTFLLLAPSNWCFAETVIEEVSPNRAKELGVTIRTNMNGQTGIQVVMEFKTTGELKRYSHVELQIGKGESRVMSAPLLAAHPGPESVVVNFSAYPAYLTRSTLMIVVSDTPLGGTGYRFKVQDFLGSHSFWAQVRSGEVRNFMVHGFKVGIRPASSWPVAANVYVPTSRLEDARQASAKLQTIIAARLAGLEKDDITQRDRCARLEDDILADARSRLPELSVQKVLLSLDIQ